MKLRYRLFLWVGIIFFLAFGLSLFFENYTTDKNLKEAETALREQILALNEKHRAHLEEYLHVMLSEDQAQIDALLLRISRDKNLGATLFLNPANLEAEASAHSAFLFKNNKWIDFIQSTKDQKLTSLIIPIDFPMKASHQIPIDDRISWVVLEDDRSFEHPYIGVKLVKEPANEKSLATLIDELIDVDWGLTILFNPKALLNYTQRPYEEEKPNKHGLNLTLFLASVKHASEYAKEQKGKLGAQWIQKDLQEKKPKDLFAGKPPDLGIQCLEKEGEVLNGHVVQLLQRGDQAIMISSLANLFPGESFGKTPFALTSPKGIARFPHGHNTGHTILSDEVFFQKKLFNDASYLEKHPSSKECEGVGGSVAVIASQNLDRVFVGNSLELNQPEKKQVDGYLTVAVDADELVEQLVLSDNKSAFLVHDKQVITAFSKDGEKISDPKRHVPFTPKMLKKKSGTIQWEGTNYYYLHMVPFKDLDLNFFIIDLEKDAFSLIRSLDQRSREVIKNVSFDMRMTSILGLALVLILLHNVAKRITNPITKLARATENVATGKLEDIQLPEAPKGRHDEIATLCHSFSEMVTGLKEKEKVKGVLNKVVSPEIAQEILKGKIHLGGEERKVTVFFADIRDFTHMSSGMAPNEVVEMLNNCMTKISHVVDDFGGVIDKYVGDELMALFGAPLEKEDSALKAVQSALEMIQVLKTWNEERKQKGLPPVEMGIGIHTGKVLVGNMGAENRLNYTVIGSNVNFAARLCGVAKGMEILISKETLEEPHVKEQIEIEETPSVELKGFEEKFVLYRVKGERHVR